MSTTRSELDLALKTLWGAKGWPGLPESALVVAHPQWSSAMRSLDQLLAVQASGLVHGGYGTGKSYLLHRWGERLSPKQVRLVRLCHSSLMGSDLIRQLVKLGGRPPALRRGDNVLALAELWREWAPAWPVVLVEEAQNLSVSALEELRLLLCARNDAKPPFSLILCGDLSLLPKLDLGVHQALLSRLSFCIRLDRWAPDSLREYLTGRLAEVGVNVSPLDAQADTLLIQSAQGSPRTLAALLQRALEQAALAQRRNVTAADVQAAFDNLPWIARSRPE